MNSTQISILITVIFLIAVAILMKFVRKKGKIEITDEFKNVLNILNNTSENIFITGKAGTGKSTLLKYFVSKTNKRYVVLAPTGVAAMNVRGQTIHSFFGFKIGILKDGDIKINYTKASLYKNLDMIIIDEVSMVGADLMNAVDLALRRNRNEPDKPFGGVQIVFIGDLFQLPPVITSDVEPYYLEKYGGFYFFNARVFNDNFKYNFFELKRIFRQKDSEFITMLNNIRENKATYEDLVKLNSRHEDNINYNEDNAIYLSTTNAIVKRLNKENLDALRGQEFKYIAQISGELKFQFDQIKSDFQKGKIDDGKFDELLDKRFPADVFLRLKKGAQIIMIKNDPSKRWVNGSLGKIKKLGSNKIWVQIKGKTYQVGKDKWEKIEYSFDSRTKKIKANSKGAFVQYPIKLAWALTIHKSQGQTFDKAIIDIGRGAFAHGQTYVALSRCKSLDGLMLKREINNSHIIVDEKIVEYYMNQRKKD